MTTIHEPLTPGTTAWGRLITASKVAAILGLSPYDSPLSCWHKMKGNIPLEQETEDHRRGHYAERAIEAWYRDEHPEFTVITREPTYHRDDLPWAAARPDAHASGRGVDDELVEFKTARDADEWGTPGTDEIPAYYFVQVMFQLHLARLRRCRVAVWGPHFQMDEYVVDYDPEIADGIIARCAEFWASLEANEPPPLDDTTATLQTLKALHPGITPGEQVELDAAVAIEFIEAKTALKAAERRERAAQSAVLAAMGAAQYGHHGKTRIARRQPGRGDGVALYQVAKTTDQITTGATS